MQNLQIFVFSTNKVISSKKVSLLAYNLNLGGSINENNSPKEVYTLTSEKPKISFTIATLHVPRYGELIASEKRALPTLPKELDEANRLKQDSSVTMRSKRHKLK